MLTFAAKHGPKDDSFWRKFEREFRRLGRRYPNLTSRRDHESAQWIIEGPAVGVSEFRRLVHLAANKAGFDGYGEESAVQWWLSLMAGDFIEQRQRRKKNPMETERVVVETDGTRVGYRGRQRIG